MGGKIKRELQAVPANADHGNSIGLIALVKNGLIHAQSKDVLTSLHWELTSTIQAALYLANILSLPVIPAIGWMRSSV